MAIDISRGLKIMTKVRNECHLKSENVFNSIIITPYIDSSFINRSELSVFAAEIGTQLVMR